MAFTNNYRMERVYFEKLKSMIDILKSFLASETDQKARAMIENGIDADGAILLLYRNLGECWAELSDLIKKANDRIDDLNDKTDAYHDELNERIDEVNNYLMAIIRDLISRVESLESRMDAVEADLAQMGRVITYDLQRVNNAWTLKEGTQGVTFEQTAEYYNHERPHLVLVRGELNSEVTYLMPREYDTNETSGLFEWYAFGFVGSEIHEITVTLLPDDSVNVAINTTDFAGILQRLSTAETNITDLQGRMTTAETDIDNLEQTDENHNERITDLESCCDIVQDALDDKQDKLVAGSGISIDPNTNEITNTAQGKIYTGSVGIYTTENDKIGLYIPRSVIGTSVRDKTSDKLNFTNNAYNVYWTLNAGKLYQSATITGKLFEYYKKCLTPDGVTLLGAPIENNFKIRVRVMFIIDSVNLFPSPTSGVTQYYCKTLFTKIIECKNGIYTDAITNAIPDHANFEFSDTIGARLPEDIGKYYYSHFNISIDFIETTKTLSEWTAYLSGLTKAQQEYLIGAVTHYRITS